MDEDINYTESESETYYYESIDYSNQLDDLYEELVNIRELQVHQINNSVETLNVISALLFFIVTCIISLNFIKVAFKK
ncbi:MAG: hypothetical protein AB2417_20105 [Clostridiaceae bacterium]